MGNITMRTIERDIVGAVIVSVDGKILNGKQAVGKEIYPGCWIIPGGGIEDGETKEQALIREVKEETGIDISECVIELVGDTRTATTHKTLRDSGELVLCNMKLFDFRIKIPQNAAAIKISPSDDLVECIWIDIQELSNFKLAPPSVDLFKQLGYIK